MEIAIPSALEELRAVAWWRSSSSKYSSSEIQRDCMALRRRCCRNAFDLSHMDEVAAYWRIQDSTYRRQYFLLSFPPIFHSLPSSPFPPSSFQLPLQSLPIPSQYVLKNPAIDLGSGVSLAEKIFWWILLSLKLTHPASTVLINCYDSQWTVITVTMKVAVTR